MFRQRVMSIFLVSGVLAAVGMASAAKIALEGSGHRRHVLDEMQGQAAPEITGTEWINTDATSLDDFKGKVVMIDFWGVWCAPCVRGVPKLKEWQEKYADQGFVLVGVHTTNLGEKVSSFVSEHGIEYTIVIDDNEKTAQRYHVDSWPDVYLVDHNGVLRYADVANRDPNNIEAAIVELLAERNASIN